VLKLKNASKYKIFQVLRWYHNWKIPQVMSQNTGTLKILCKISFRLWVEGVYETNKFCVYTWVPSLRYLIMYMQILLTLKLFWSISDKGYSAYNSIWCIHLKCTSKSFLIVQSCASITINFRPSSSPSKVWTHEQLLLISSQGSYA
jgi:hypothetical protein